ncbi:MAG TPA: alkyl sulfatase dimerization domain-containing protein [Candidatus Nitrosotalea sp.]|nr:alkyl sulfatase dimerization domain-containing protein [Candidatus Nitrosotalea sp.]
MPDVRALAEQLWRGDIDTVEHHPVSGMASAGEEIAPGVLFFKGIASANTVDTGDGLVMLDTGSRADTRPLHEAVRRWRPDAPLAAAVFSHHHVDHIFGVGPFEREAAERRWPRPRVYAHALVRTNFERYLKTLGWNTAINIRQFHLPPDRFRWPDAYRYPDVEIEDALTFSRGGLSFELRHARGETEDAIWTWIPETKILAPGDLFIWAAPNAGNPQKVQRYPGEWAVALRAMAALGAELLVPGHGLPIWGADRIRVALTDTARVLESIEEQVLALMNAGVTLDRVLHAVRVPRELLDKPYLRPVYDDPEFIVRNVWRLYGGWWDGEPDNLLPAPRADQAREWVALAGGLGPVLARAAALLAAGDARLACHLVEFAVIAEPGSREAHELRQEIYATRSRGQISSMARNILNHAALASAQGKRDLAGQS